MAAVKNKQSLSEIFSGIASGVTGVYVFFILTIFPLYTHDKYFDILGARYVVFKIWAISLAVILSFLGLTYLFIDAKNQSSSPSALKRLIDAFKINNIKKYITITDIFFVAMIISMTISTIGSEFKEESFYGNAGRYQGLECWLLYLISYFCITRTFKFKRFYLDFAILAGCFACIWGTLDFFWLDPFGFFRNVSAQQKGMFASSIGNLNTYTNYTIMVYALAGSLFVIEKNPIRSIFYALTSFIGCAGSIFGLADNIVLGFFGFYLFLPFFTFKNRRQFLRYLILIDILLFSAFTFWLGLKLPHNTWQSSFFQDFVSKSGAPFLFIPFTILVIIVAIIFYKIKPNYGTEISNNLNPLDSILPKQFKLVYTAIVCIGFLIVTYILLDMNVFKQHVDLWNQIPSSHQLVFNDYWGTHRGHNWRIAFTNFTQNFSVFQRLFGYGPDTYLVVSERTFYEEMVTRFGEVYDSAHNEYINYLICEGLIGLICYLGIFITGLRTGVKNLIKNPYILAPIIAVIAYMVQAIVNIAIPITTPIFFTLMYMCVAEHFNKNEVV
jgi:hypothetical protein